MDNLTNSKNISLHCCVQLRSLLLAVHPRNRLDLELIVMLYSLFYVLCLYVISFPVILIVTNSNTHKITLIHTYTHTHEFTHNQKLTQIKSTHKESHRSKVNTNTHTHRHLYPPFRNPLLPLNF